MRANIWPIKSNVNVLLHIGRRQPQHHVIFAVRLSTIDLCDGATPQRRGRSQRAISDQKALAVVECTNRSTDPRRRIAHHDFPLVLAAFYDLG